MSVLTLAVTLSLMPVEIQLKRVALMDVGTHLLMRAGTHSSIRVVTQPIPVATLVPLLILVKIPVSRRSHPPRVVLDATTVVLTGVEIH